MSIEKPTENVYSTAEKYEESEWAERMQRAAKYHIEFGRGYASLKTSFPANPDEHQEDDERLEWEEDGWRKTIGPFNSLSELKDWINDDKRAFENTERITGVEEDEWLGTEEGLEEMSQIEEQLLEMTAEKRKTKHVASFVYNNQTREPELQAWIYKPNSSDQDRNNPRSAWFNSGHTGAGSASPNFEGDTKKEAVEKAREWAEDNL